jgi:hypothetical protein
MPAPTREYQNDHRRRFPSVDCTAATNQVKVKNRRTAAREKAKAKASRPA